MLVECFDSLAGTVICDESMKPDITDAFAGVQGVSYLIASTLWYQRI